MRPTQQTVGWSRSATSWNFGLNARAATKNHDAMPSIIKTIAGLFRVRSMGSMNINMAIAKAIRKLIADSKAATVLSPNGRTSVPA